MRMDRGPHFRNCTSYNCKRKHWTHCTVHPTHLACSNCGIQDLAKCGLSSSSGGAWSMSRWGGALIPGCKLFYERNLESSCTRHVMAIIIAFTHIYICTSGLFSICFSDRKLKHQAVWFKTRHMATVFTTTSLAARRCAICVHMYYVCHVLLNPCNCAVFYYYFIDDKTEVQRG